MVKGTEVGLRGTLQIRTPSFYHLQGFAARKRRVEPPSRNSTHREPFPEDRPPACRAECKQEGARVADTQEKLIDIPEIWSCTLLLDCMCHAGTAPQPPGLATELQGCLGFSMHRACVAPFRPIPIGLSRTKPEAQNSTCGEGVFIIVVYAKG